MNKWVKAVLIGFIISIIIAALFGIFTTVMAKKVPMWREMGITLSQFQKLAVQFSFLFLRSWYVIVPGILIVCIGLALIIAAVKK